MKKNLEYLGLLLLTIFGFYYTDKVTLLLNSKDPLMIYLKEYKEKNTTECKEGYITKEGIVMGTNGYTIDIDESYSRMQGNTFNKDLLVFKELTCKVNTKNISDDYIIKGNESKNMISIFIKINDLSNIKTIVSEFNKYNVKVNLITNGVLLSKNIDLFKNMYNLGNKIVYNGTSSNDLKLFLNTMDMINNKENNYCISLTKDDTTECKEKLPTLKASNIYSKDIYYNTISNLDKGSFYIFNENNYIIKEINPLIKYVNAKNITIVNIEELFK